MSNETIGMILTAIWGLLGIIAGGKAIITIRAFIKAMKESTEVGDAIDAVMASITTAEKDGVWTGQEITQIEKSLEEVKVRIKEAKDAWSNVFMNLLKK